MPSKHSDGPPELDSLCRVCERLLRLQVSPKDTQRDVGGERRERQRDGVAGSRSRRGCGEGRQMEVDEEWGTWERQKDGKGDETERSVEGRKADGETEGKPS